MPLHIIRSQFQSEDESDQRFMPSVIVIVLRLSYCSFYLCRYTPEWTSQNLCAAVHSFGRCSLWCHKGYSDVTNTTPRWISRNFGVLFALHTCYLSWDSFEQVSEGINKAAQRGSNNINKDLKLRPCSPLIATTLPAADNYSPILSPYLSVHIKWPTSTMFALWEEPGGSKTQSGLNSKPSCCKATTSPPLPAL